jgi:hypothetical protein
MRMTRSAVITYDSMTVGGRQADAGGALDAGEEEMDVERFAMFKTEGGRD